MSAAVAVNDAAACRATAVGVWRTTPITEDDRALRRRRSGKTQQITISVTGAHNTDHHTTGRIRHTHTGRPVGAALAAPTTTDTGTLTEPPCRRPPSPKNESTRSVALAASAAAACRANPLAYK